MKSFLWHSGEEIAYIKGRKNPLIQHKHIYENIQEEIPNNQKSIKT